MRASASISQMLITRHARNQNAKAKGTDTTTSNESTSIANLTAPKRVRVGTRRSNAIVFINPFLLAFWHSQGSPLMFNSFYDCCCWLLGKSKGCHSGKRSSKLLSAVANLSIISRFYKRSCLSSQCADKDTLYIKYDDSFSTSLLMLDFVGHIDILMLSKKTTIWKIYRKH